MLENLGKNMINLSGKRVLVTQANEFMGPSLCETLPQFGASVIADKASLVEPDSSRKLIEEVGDIDVLIVNLAVKDPANSLEDVTEDEWMHVFSAIVHPLPRLVKAVIPQMKKRGSGKIILMGSASALKGMKRASTYSAARGAQLSFVQAVGVELARDNIQVNALAQIFVDNPTYFPEEVQQNPRFKERLKREVPLGRLIEAKEDASFVAYLCTDMANCFVGQIFPMSGGWVVR